MNVVSKDESALVLRLDKTSAPFVIVVTLFFGILLGFGISRFVSSINTFSASLSEQSTSVNYDNDFIKQIHEILKNEYLGNVPADKDITYSITKGIIESLDDPYTLFLTPEETSRYNESKNPNFEGIGVSLQFESGNTVIESVLKGYPAEKAGLKAGDIMYLVDGIDVLGKYPSEVANMVRGEKDTEVKITVSRSSENNSERVPINFIIKRDHIDTDNVSYENLGQGLYKVNISQFIDESAEDFNKSWDKVVKQMNEEEGDINKIVVDLRNNPGGYVYSLRHVLEEFMPRNTILLKEQNKNEDPVIYTDQRNGSFEDVSLVVLVNESSASASEIFAAAIQDNGRGKVVGEKTVGKGVEQKPVIMDDGSMLIMVFQKWLTPKDRNINKDNPITPDFIIDYSEQDFKNGKDPQMDKALELINVM